MQSVNDDDRCLYTGTLWEAELITDRRDLDMFKEVARTIGTMLLVRTFIIPLGSLLWVLEYHGVE
jgi:activator of HSP90 ATPase